jgi:hypothetical protein
MHHMCGRYVMTGATGDLLSCCDAVYSEKDAMLAFRLPVPGAANGRKAI